MDASNIQRPETPPHYPIYGVNMPLNSIQRLISLGFPNSELVAVTPLPSGRSYNNRIYYLKLRDKCKAVQPMESAQKETDFVLKVNGRFFGAEKIQNEVSCLRILEKFCPDVPSPRILAWSEVGKHMSVISNSRSNTLSLEVSEDAELLSGWILMTRTPGEPISIGGYNEVTMKRLAVQLADHVTQWRQLIPIQSHCGNLRFYKQEWNSMTPNLSLNEPDISNDSCFVIRGILSENITSLDRITGLNDYYQMKLQGKLLQLETVATYARNRAVVGLIQDFIKDGLPNLDLVKREARNNTRGNGISQTGFVFTHFDLSPRNILSSGTPPTITGIVDFEFAGFFFPMEEFLNDYIGNRGDWPGSTYDAYMDRLNENGIATPERGIDRCCWEQALWLEELLQNIAPWWLPGEFEGVGLETELKKSEVVVRETLDKLAHLSY